MGWEAVEGYCPLSIAGSRMAKEVLWDLNLSLVYESSGERVGALGGQYYGGASEVVLQKLSRLGAATRKVGASLSTSKVGRCKGCTSVERGWIWVACK